MDSNSHVKVLESWVVCLLAFIIDDLNHLEANLNHFVGFFDLHRESTPFLRNLACIAHDDVTVSDGMDLVDFALVAEFIELAEEPRQQSDHFLWFRHILRKLCKSNHISVEKCYIVKQIDHFLVILDTLQHMLWNKLAKQFLCLLDLNLNNPFVIVDLA